MLTDKMMKGKMLTDKMMKDKLPNGDTAERQKLACKILQDIMSKGQNVP